MNKVVEKWDEILQIVKTEHDLSDVSFNTWLKPLTVYEVVDNVVTIIVPSEQVGLNYISKKYKLPLQVTISEVTGMENCDINFILPEDVPKKEEVSPKAQSQDARCEEAHLNPKYTFDTFVVGSNNKFAQAAALAVAESPGDTYNPLFIYGGAGLGKTHLLHSIAHFIIDHDENSKVLYVTSEEFTNELIETIRNGNNSAMTKFREKYRNIDVLLVDDIQFIIGKESTQEEFFHTFNSLHSAKKQIIISLGVVIAVVAIALIAMMITSGNSDNGQSSSLKNAVQQESNGNGSDDVSESDAGESVSEEDAGESGDNMTTEQPTTQETTTEEVTEEATTAAKNNTASNVMDADDGYIFPDADTSYVSKSSVKKLSDEELQYAVNEVYARHGLKFTKKKNKERFEKKEWYVGTVDDQNDISLNKYEKKNVDTMAAELKKRGLR